MGPQKHIYSHKHERHHNNSVGISVGKQITDIGFVASFACGHRHKYVEVVMMQRRELSPNSKSNQKTQQI